MANDFTVSFYFEFFIRKYFTPQQLKKYKNVKNKIKMTYVFISPR